HLAIEQCSRNAFERFAVRLKKLPSAVISVADDALYFLIDLHRRVFGEVPMLRNFAPQENRFFLLAERQWSKLAHAPFANHVPSDVRRSLNIVASAGRYVPKE